MIGAVVVGTGFGCFTHVRALRADAVLTCGWLAQLSIGARWIDCVASLAIVYFLVKEARKAWAVKQCHCSACH